METTTQEGGRGTLPGTATTMDVPTAGPPHGLAVAFSYL
jgi:hypothetical protein